MMYHMTLAGIHAVTALTGHFFWKYTLLYLDISINILPKSHAEFIFITLIS